MKIRTVGLITATLMCFAAGTIQASCTYNTPGWHMVSKKCAIKPAETWQEYTSGVYIQPVTGRSVFPLLGR